MCVQHAGDTRGSEHHRAKADRIVCPDTEEERGHEGGQRERRPQADDDADDGDPRGLSEHQSDDIAHLRAECDRTPISRDRRATLYGKTPNSLPPASASAATAKPVSSVAYNRGLDRLVVTRSSIKCPRGGRPPPLLASRASGIQRSRHDRALDRDRPGKAPPDAGRENHLHAALARLEIPGRGSPESDRPRGANLLQGGATKCRTFTVALRNSASRFPRPIPCTLPSKRALAQGRKHVFLVPSDVVEDVRRRVHASQTFKQDVAELLALNAKVMVFERQASTREE